MYCWYKGSEEKLFFQNSFWTNTFSWIQVTIEVSDSLLWKEHIKNCLIPQRWHRKQFTLNSRFECFEIIEQNVRNSEMGYASFCAQQHKKTKICSWRTAALAKNLLRTWHALRQLGNKTHSKYGLCARDQIGKLNTIFGQPWNLCYSLEKSTTKIRFAAARKRILESFLIQFGMECILGTSLMTTWTAAWANKLGKLYGQHNGHENFNSKTCTHTWLTALEWSIAANAFLDKLWLVCLLCTPWKRKASWTSALTRNYSQQKLHAMPGE